MADQQRAIPLGLQQSRRQPRAKADHHQAQTANRGGAAGPAPELPTISGSVTTISGRPRYGSRKYNVETGGVWECPERCSSTKGFINYSSLALHMIMKHDKTADDVYEASDEKWRLEEGRAPDTGAIVVDLDAAWRKPSGANLGPLGRVTFCKDCYEVTRDMPKDAKGNPVQVALRLLVHKEAGDVHGSQRVVNLRCSSHYKKLTFADIHTDIKTRDVPISRLPTTFSVWDKPTVSPDGDGEGEAPVAGGNPRASAGRQKGAGGSSGKAKLGKGERKRTARHPEVVGAAAAAAGGGRNATAAANRGKGGTAAIAVAAAPLDAHDPHNSDAEAAVRCKRRRFFPDESSEDEEGHEEEGEAEAAMEEDANGNVGEYDQLRDDAGGDEDFGADLERQDPMADTASDGHAHARNTTVDATGDLMSIVKAFNTRQLKADQVAPELQQQVAALAGAEQVLRLTNSGPRSYSSDDFCAKFRAISESLLAQRRCLKLEPSDDLDKARALVTEHGRIARELERTCGDFLSPLTSATLTLFEGLDELLSEVQAQIKERREAEKKALELEACLKHKDVADYFFVVNEFVAATEVMKRELQDHFSPEMDAVLAQVEAVLKELPKPAADPGAPKIVRSDQHEGPRVTARLSFMFGTLLERAQQAGVLAAIIAPKRTPTPIKLKLSAGLARVTEADILAADQAASSLAREAEFLRERAQALLIGNTATVQELQEAVGASEETAQACVMAGEEAMKLRAAFKAGNAIAQASTQVRPGLDVLAMAAITSAGIMPTPMAAPRFTPCVRIDPHVGTEIQETQPPTQFVPETQQG